MLTKINLKPVCADHLYILHMLRVFAGENLSSV